MTFIYHYFRIYGVLMIHVNLIECSEDITGHKPIFDINTIYMKGNFAMKMSKRILSASLLAACIATLGIVTSAKAANTAVGSVGTGYVNVPSRSRVSAWTEANSSGSSSADYVEAGFNAYTWGGTIYTPEETNASASYVSGGSSESFQTVRNTGSSFIKAESFQNDGISIETVNSYHAIKRENILYATVINGTKSGS